MYTKFWFFWILAHASTMAFAQVYTGPYLQKTTATSTSILWEAKGEQQFTVRWGESASS